MQYTTKLNLKKPDSTDYVNVSDINDNMEILDNAVSSLQEGSSEIPDLQTNDKKLAGAINEVNTKVTKHLEDSMPHKITDGLTTYKTGWKLNAAKDGLIFVYEEVV